MKQSDIPARFPIPFADQATSPYIRPIPKDSQIGIVDGAASLETGWPPLNFILRSFGGVPPFGQDFNGLNNQITAWSRWQGAGGGVTYDATFASDIGGYPKGAILASTTFALFWLSTIDDNTEDPDAGTSSVWAAFRLPVPGSIITSGLTFSMQLVFGIYALNRSTDLSGMQTINLPPVTNRYALSWKLIDIAGNLNAHPATVVPPVGHTISGRANFVMNEDFQWANFTFLGNTVWSLET